MCIRDSFHDLPFSAKSTYRHTGTDDFSVSYQIRLDSEPVSYTHLDVYKRQVRICGLQGFLDTSDICCTAAVEGSTETYYQQFEMCIRDRFSSRPTTLVRNSQDHAMASCLK